MVMAYTIEEIKDIIKPIAEKYQLPAVYLFGSYARGEADEDSDIDLAVDLTGTNLPWGGISALIDLESAFPISVDCLSMESIMEANSPIEKLVKKNFERDRVLLYENRPIRSRLYVS
ncbi:nucleotidyltransferase family protein [Streptococcus pluranimalium]|uniref:nucleotidyltransferase family protein n=1 Tax=Streptococcus pluranimalium TaxID=82348 RepID=UPI0039FDA821